MTLTSYSSTGMKSHGDIQFSLAEERKKFEVDALPTILRPVLVFIPWIRVRQNQNTHSFPERSLSPLMGISAFVSLAGLNTGL